MKRLLSNPTGEKKRRPRKNRSPQEDSPKQIETVKEEQTEVAIEETPEENPQTEIKKR